MSPTGKISVASKHSSVSSPVTISDEQLDNLTLPPVLRGDNKVLQKYRLDLKDGRGVPTRNTANTNMQALKSGGGGKSL